MTYAKSAQELQVEALLQRFGVAQQGGGQLLTLAGPTTLYTPASGNLIRLKWLYLGSQTAATATEVTVKLGSTTVYVVPIVAGGIFAHASVREGAADGTLDVTLNPAANVYVDYELEEQVP